MSHAEERWAAAPILGVRDVRAAADYYCNVLGFTCDPENGIFDGVGDEPAVYAIVHRGALAVHLQIRRREIFSGKRPGFESDVYFYVPDANALYDELRERGATFARTPDDSAYGLRDFVVEDPDGHRLAFGSPT